jgi:hypothetical protein
MPINRDCTIAGRSHAVYPPPPHTHTPAPGPRASRPASTQVLEQLGVQGVLILEVPAGTPAAAAGLRPTYRDVFGDIVLGDIIVGECPMRTVHV